MVLGVSTIARQRLNRKAAADRAVPEVGALIDGFDAVGGGSADESSAPAVCWTARLV
jgi:hypothetical protein